MENQVGYSYLFATVRLFLAHQADDQRPMKDWVLTKESELRIEVLEDDTIDIKVIA